MPFYKKQHSDHAFYREDQLGIPFIFRPLFAEIINPRSSPFGWERGFDFVCYFPVNALEILCTALCPVSSLSMQMHTLQMHGLSFKFTTTPYLTHRRQRRSCWTSSSACAGRYTTAYQWGLQRETGHPRRRSSGSCIPARYLVHSP